MKQLAYLVLISMVLFSYSTGQARNTVIKASIEEALAWGEQEGVLDNSVGLYFGDQAHQAVEQTHGTYTANRKTNGVGKSDQKACQWAFLSAMAVLQQRAVREGANAVINIRSYYYKKDFSSATEFECGAGNIMAGVTMVGDVVTLAE
ncbi:MAG: excinuclease ABC subunit A [Woeseiaceae bacterium]|nr:excinuclease ABC subunit A [Woeseiaceae bacterium]